MPADAIFRGQWLATCGLPSDAACAVSDAFSRVSLRARGRSSSDAEKTCQGNSIASEKFFDREAWLKCGRALLGSNRVHMAQRWCQPASRCAPRATHRPTTSIPIADNRDGAEGMREYTHPTLGLVRCTSRYGEWI